MIQQLEAAKSTALDFPKHHAPSERPHAVPDLLSIDLDELLKVVWRRKMLIAIGMVIGLVLGAAYYMERSPVYQTQAQVLVVKKRPQVIPGIDLHPSYFEDDASTQVMLLKSPLIVSRAVKSKNLASLPSFAGLGDPTGVIVRSLSVASDTKDAVGSSSCILELTYRGPQADDCLVVLTAIIDSYQEFLDETCQNINEDALALITHKADEVRQELREKKEKYKEFRDHTPLLWNPKTGGSAYHDRLAAAEAKRLDIRLRRSEIESKLTKFEGALARGADRDTLLAMIDDKTGAYAGMQDNLLPLIMKEKNLLQDYGPGHPDVQAVRRQIEITQKFYSLPPAARSQVLESTADGNDPHPMDPVTAYADRLRRELQEVQTEQEAVDRNSEQAQNEAKEMTKYEFEEKQVSDDIARAEQFHDTLIKQLQSVNFGKDLIGYNTSTIAPPHRGAQVEPKTSLVFLSSAFLGILGGLGLVVLAEVTDKSFRTPEDIRRRLGLPLVGHVPWLEHANPTDESLDPILCTYHRSDSVEAEAYRGVRTSLYFNIHRAHHKVIQITSPNMGDGKSSLAANLAVSIAQSGKKTLLVDADMRRPRIHKIFGLQAEVGLASVISGDATLEDAVQHSGIPDLWILPCGALPGNPGDLLTSPKFEELLAILREQYDCVLLDTPALLAVTDPRVVAPRVDGVLLTIRVSKNGRTEADRAKEILSTLGARILGVVVNGISSDLSGDYPRDAYYLSYSKACANGVGAQADSRNGN